MKRILLVFLFVFSAFQAFSQVRGIELKVNNIGLGASDSSVLRRIGKPMRTGKTSFNECGGGLEKSFFYSGLKMNLLGDDKGKNFSVVSIEVNSPKWSVSGIKIGADRKSVQAKFGKPSDITRQAGLEKWSYANKGNDGGAVFYFRNNRLVKIVWESLLC